MIEENGRTFTYTADVRIFEVVRFVLTWTFGLPKVFRNILYCHHAPSLTV